MTNVIRFGVSLEKELLKIFDNKIRKKGYTNRSEAIRDLIRKDLIVEKWKSGKNIAATITLVYSHHQRGLEHKLTHLQHDHFREIISTLHVHLDKKKLYGSADIARKKRKS